MRLTVVYDNHSAHDEIQSAWGFSCLVEGSEKTVLFDTGGQGPAFMANMEKLHLPPARVDAVVISHFHWDHTGGLKDFLGANPNVDVYMPALTPPDVKEIVSGAGSNPIEVDGPADVCPGIRTTGAMKGAKGPAEQALVLSTRAETAVVTGCAHPGVVEIVERAMEMTGRDISLLLGGFHLHREGAGNVRSVAARLKEIGVGRVAPCHCTGDRSRDIFEGAFGGRYIDCRAGTTFEV
jgi:7,8-dihydropterin-6-yl-methyl-4-(beta-D-ribofuranosyl)aminobenzene 5'-phosphate synthase